MCVEGITLPLLDSALIDFFESVLSQERLLITIYAVGSA